MITYFVVLKGTNKEMAMFELEELWRTFFNENISLKQIQNTYYFFTAKNSIHNNHFLLQRLTLTHYLGILLYEGISFEEFSKKMLAQDFSYLNDQSFAIEEHFIGDKAVIEASLLAKPIWENLETPKVDLKNPDNVFFSVSLYDKLYFSKQIFSNSRKYLERMPKLRPIAKPYTLKSDMARTAINYLGLKQGVVLDPFCGVGGILLEAYDCGFEVVGNDISQKDTLHTKTNFKHFFPNGDIELNNCDAREQFLDSNSLDGIVTDIPYGKSSRRLGLTLYDDFLRNAVQMLKPGGRLVVIYANFVEFYDLALQHFSYVNQLDFYINKSMTRHILVLENAKKIL